MKKLLSSLVLGASLLAPAAALYAQDHPHHQWSDNENTTWHQYLKERHKKDHDWSKANKREQSDYWKWRDQHPDSH